MPHQCLKCGELFNEGTTIILRGCPECRGTRFFYTQTPLTMSEREKLLATSEVTLREAIDRLVQQAKDGEKITDEDGARWSISGPPATKVVADPALVPNDLPVSRPTLSVDVDEKKLIVKVPQPAKAPKLLRRKKKDPIRWDYQEPEPVAWSPPAPHVDFIPRAQPPAPVVAPVPTPPIAEPAPPPPAVEAPRSVEPTPVVAAKPPMPNPTLDSFLPPTPPAKTEHAPAMAQPAERAITYAPSTPDPEILPSGEAPETIRISKPGEYEIDVKRLLESNPIVIQRDGTYLIHLASLFESNRPKAD